ncbi:MAG: hypothetical protein IKH65_07410 [Clostridia bacterium]|nr:hypothetical protein [Clostridia bacterium]
MGSPNGSVGRTTNLVNNTYERYDYDQGERLTGIVGGELDSDGNDGQENYRISYGYDNNRLSSRTYSVGGENRKTENNQRCCSCTDSLCRRLDWV